MLETVSPWIAKKAIKIVKIIPTAQLKRLEKKFENFSNLTLFEILPTILNTKLKIKIGIKIFVKSFIIIALNVAKTGWKVDAVTVPPSAVIKVKRMGKIISVWEAIELITAVVEFKRDNIILTTINAIEAKQTI